MLSMTFKKIFYTILVGIISTIFTCYANCDCCLKDVITKKKIKELLQGYTESEEIMITKEGILQHLKLDNGKLNDIVTDVNNSVDNLEKIKKILKYAVDIEWDKEMCPNTLIKQEDNLCSYISYFHLMLNNPYFLKFFLICDRIKSLHREDTHVLNAMCEAVRWCVDNPSFDPKNMGSVAKIVRAVFRKKSNNDDEFFYCEKKHQKDQGLYIFFYGSQDANGEWNNKPQDYGIFLYADDIYENANKCLFIDLQVHDDTEKTKQDITKKLTGILSWSANSLFIEFFYDDNEELDEDSLTKIIKKSKEGVYVSPSNYRKILGMRLTQTDWHLFAVPNYNGIWYNKNTLGLQQKKMSMKDTLHLINAVLKQKKRVKKKFNSHDCSLCLLSDFSPQKNTT